MEKQKRHNIRFKTPKRYRLSLYNENSLNRLWTVKMGRKSLILLITVAVLAIFSGGVMLISLTPLRTFLPGYLSGSERYHLMQVDERADSLAARLDIYGKYLDNVAGIMTGSVSPDSMMVVVDVPADSASAVKADTVALIGRNAAESEFVRMYSERENFDLDDRQELLAEAPLFVSPVRDAMVTVGNDPTVATIEVTHKDAGVHAINRGTVVDQYRSDDGGYVVIIQHPDGYLSRYSGLSRIFTRPGVNIDADSRIGRYVNDGKTPLRFELRRDGQALKPLEYIPF
ncbi:MAG: M23 family metallopeptidase [Bacteroidales bacterium]|nr:M23 family metallopeptidase [Bacteroidales bacterium]MBD5228467.1 M23 family metallopeptidase [Bacteroidales bacterium]MBD5235722.1 M23 family metallopeptidase [Barnesiella sp.]MBD5247761.1 M23 family metallopeptidase [Barnesiella sp.]